MSSLRVDNISSRTGTTVTIPSGNRFYAPGHVLQVVQTVKTDTFTTSSASPVDIPGMSVSITPTSITSKLLIMTDLKWTSSAHSDIYLLRNGIKIFYGDLYSNQTQSLLHGYGGGGDGDYSLAYGHSMYLDSPATLSTVTYKLQAAVPYSTSYVIAVNYMRPNQDATYNSRVASSMTVMEIGV